MRRGGRVQQQHMHVRTHPASTSSSATCNVCIPVYFSQCFKQQDMHACLSKKKEGRSSLRGRVGLPGRARLASIQQAQADSVLAHAHKAARTVDGVQHPVPPLRCTHPARWVHQLRAPCMCSAAQGALTAAARHAANTCMPAGGSSGRDTAGTLCSLNPESCQQVLCVIAGFMQPRKKTVRSRRLLPVKLKTGCVSEPHPASPVVTAQPRQLLPWNLEPSWRAEHLRAALRAAQVNQIQDSLAFERRRALLRLQHRIDQLSDPCCHRPPLFAPGCHGHRVLVTEADQARYDPE